jgi:hypothetical protein
MCRATAWMAALLLLTYLTGSFPLAIVHSADDHAVHVDHSAEAESDPCHISAYHKERAGGCEHRTHLDVDQSCMLCDVQAPCAQALLSVASFVTINFAEACHPAAHLTCPDRPVYFHSDRGPPVC